MKKILTLLLCILLMGCSFHSSKSYTFNIETGDSIKVTLKTGNGYDLKQENGRFSITKDDTVISQGIFLKEETKNDFYLKLDNFEKHSYDNGEYIYYETEGEAGIEYNYFVVLKGSKAGIVVASLEGREEAKKAFERLFLKKED